MGTKEYGALCKHYAQENDLSMSALARELILAFAVHEGEKRAVDAGAVSDIFKGKRTIDAPLYHWLNTILGIPQAEAEAAMLEHYRRFRESAVASPSTEGRALMNPLATRVPALGTVARIDELAERRTRRQRRQRRQRRRLEPAA